MADCRRQFSQSEEDFRLSMYNRMNENTPSGVFLFFYRRNEAEVDLRMASMQTIEKDRIETGGDKNG